ncbi:MAG: DNA translocase FtsK, partial [Clostridia bacterium]|nr:DNA translocase FtsK [Clostridia bacterium]
SDASVSPETGEPLRSTMTPQPSDPYADYCPPPLSLLKPGQAKMSASSEEEIRRNAENLIDTLNSFNITATINHVSRGPRITRYELRPEKGIRIRSITNLIDDISMSLATPGIRIEAPIPGVAAVGVEVPNRDSTAVRLRDMLDNDKFRQASSKTTVCVGSDVTGDPVYGDIAKMPHALIAGATGMGKSVCINSILISLLYKARPDEVKLILVDPKKVELGVYNGIPHLLVPVVVEPQKAAGALVWAVGEMERRFNLIEQTAVRDLKGYNKVVREHPELGGTPLPQIVIVIDELNDLMMSARDAVEDAICRIAQKARAAGIHLLIGTQRPSVDVLTGVIKANIPSRLAFHVASQVDSRTILDTGGAEKLLDRGDMLFFPVGSPKPIRVQGALVDDDEVERVTSFLKQGVAEGTAYDSEIMANIEREAEKCTPKDKRAERDEDDEFGDDDDIFRDPQFIAAVEIAVHLGQISTSKIQTKLRIGFQKATNFIDRMEEMGIVGPHNGSKPRDVLITPSEFLEMKARH